MNWFQARDTLAVGDRVQFWTSHDIYPETVVASGERGTVVGVDKGNEMILVLPDNPDLREALAHWDGEVQFARNNYEDTEALPIEHLAVPRDVMRYVVRDVATKGVDFLVWGDNDAAAADVTYRKAKADGLDVELVVMPASRMDEHTRRLIEGEVVSGE